MTKQLLKFTQTISVFVVAITLVFSPVFAQAATKSSDYQPQTLQEMIAYLYGIIAQLQAQLDAQKGRTTSYVNTSSSQVGVAKPRSVSSSYIEVETLNATNIDDEEADLKGRVDLNNRSYAYVWFEYGEDKDLDESTSRKRITDSRSGWQTVSVNVDDLQGDEKYYFRIVGEDSSGNREYGSIRSFVTDDYRSGNSSSNSSNNGDYSLDVSDTSVDVGDYVYVDWGLPSKYEKHNNWVGLFKVGDSNREYITWQHTGTKTNGTMLFLMKDEGKYEFRLFLDSGYDDKVMSRRITVD